MPDAVVKILCGKAVDAAILCVFRSTQALNGTGVIRAFA